jgi:ankyrin repeat protein
LLDHGADVNQRATFGGLSHGQGVTALHLVAQSLVAQNKDLATAKLLVERGADLTIKDDLYQGSPMDWAKYFGATEMVRYFQSISPG